MRIAVAGGTGRIGRYVMETLRGHGHQAVSLSRGEGVDLVAGTGLDERLAGVEVVVDVTNPPVRDIAESERIFTAISENLVGAGARAGVRHHVALSICAVTSVQGNAHYFGKRAQEAAVAAGPVPYSIVPATQFHDFPAMIAEWGIVDGVAHVPPLLMQPVAPSDVGNVLAEVAEGEPLGRHPGLAGPRTEDAVDMARRTLAARGVDLPLLASWQGGALGVEFAGEVLLPGDGVRLAPTTFDDWLAAGAV